MMSKILHTLVSKQLMYIVLKILLDREDRNPAPIFIIIYSAYLFKTSTVCVFVQGGGEGGGRKCPKAR